MVNISHLLFVYDTLVFSGANPDHLSYLRALFLCFGVVFGLKINMAKSELVYVGNVNNVDGLTGIFGCGVSYLPLNILVFRLEPLIRLSLFGTMLLKR